MMSFEILSQNVTQKGEREILSFFALDLLMALNLEGSGPIGKYSPQEPCSENRLDRAQWEMA